MTKKYTKEFLISELQRFCRENGRTPTQLDMQGKFGYPSFRVYVTHFDSFNNGLETANIKPNQYKLKYDGSETCCICGCYKKLGQSWVNKGLLKGKVICIRCYNNSYRKPRSDYKYNNLDKNSSVGKGFISQRAVAKVLGLECKYDCNISEGFDYPYDLYNKNRYNYINVKGSQLCDNNAWYFDFTQKETPDTYVMLGYDKNRKNILHVWITDPLDDLTYDEKKERPKRSISITNNINSGLKRAKPWEVDAKPYNDMLHKMSDKRKETKGEECFLSNIDLEGGYD